MKNFWKKTASGLLALLIVAGASPASAVIKTFGSSALTAHAEGSIEALRAFSVMLVGQFVFLHTNTSDHIIDSHTENIHFLQ